MKIIIVMQREHKEHFTLQTPNGKVEIALDREKDKELFEALMDAYRYSQEVQITVTK